MRLVLYFLFLFFPIALPAEAVKDNKPTEVPQPEIPQPPKDLNEPLYPLELNKLKKENDRFYSELVSMLVTLGFILAFLLLVAWFLKRLMHTRVEQMNVNSKVKVIERRMLSQKTSLFLIDIDGRTLLITESSGGSSIAELSKAPPTSFKEIVNGPMDKNGR